VQQLVKDLVKTAFDNPQGTIEFADWIERRVGTVSDIELSEAVAIVGYERIIRISTAETPIGTAVVFLPERE
jgi:hypothetical protein